MKCSRNKRQLKDSKIWIKSYGDECTRRIKGGDKFDTIDGVWTRPFLKDLKYDESAVKADLTVTLRRRPHSHRMWLFGTKKHRRLVEWKPRWNEEEQCWMVRGGSVYLAVWCDKEFFPELDDQQPVEVFISTERTK